MTGTAYVIDQLGQALEASHQAVTQQQAHIEMLQNTIRQRDEQIEAQAAEIETLGAPDKP